MTINNPNNNGTVRTDLLPVLSDVRDLLGPDGVDFRPTSVSIVTRTWPNGQPGGPGQPTDSPLALPNFTKVRHVTQREIQGSAGRYEEGDLVVGPITPFFTDYNGATGGFTEQQLAPVATRGVEIIYRCAPQAGATGIAGDYALVDMQRDKSLRLMLVIGRKRTTPRVAAAPVLP